MKKFFIAIFALLTVSTFSRAIPNQPYPYRHINDLTGEIFPAERADSLERVLCAFDDSTSNQIYAVVTYDLEDYSMEEYSNRLFNSWGIGSKANNNGVLILIKAKKQSSDRGGVRIEVGDGLSGVITDARAGRIIDNYMMDYLSAGDMMSAVKAACDVIMPLAAGEFGSDGSEFDEEDMLGDITIALMLFAVLVGVAVILRNGQGDGNNGNNGTGGGGFYPRGGSFGSFGGGSFGGGGFSGGGGGFSSGGGAGRGF